MNLWYLLLALPFSILVPRLPMPDFFASASLPVAPAEEFVVTLDGIDVSASSAPQALRLTDVFPEAYLIGLAGQFHLGVHDTLDVAQGYGASPLIFIFQGGKLE